jgi:serine/threonine-protein kinase
MSTTDLPGSSLLAGRYRLVERLGAGGMSVVWRGFDEVLGRQVAVKVLPPSTSADPSFRRRLRAEAQAAARLSHQHITNVYDYGEATTVDGEPVPYVVMELIDGESLAAVLARVRRLPWQHAVRITAEVAAALAAAHARGIVHRDVTPANVMLTSSGAKVVDFGISALIGENDIDPDGSLLGTPAYLAPERLEGGQVSPATDVYAVGLLIYRTLIGQLPWDVGTTTALLRAHQYVEPDPLPPVEGMPATVSALVGRCLEKRPADRPSSAELAHVLAGVAARAPVTGRGYAGDWAENAEDTTILPSPRSDSDVIRRAPAFPPPVSPAAAGPSMAPVGYSSVIAQRPLSADTPPPVRNSRFGALRSGPVAGAAAAVAAVPVPPAPVPAPPLYRATPPSPSSAPPSSAQPPSAQPPSAQPPSAPPSSGGAPIRPPYGNQPPAPSGPPSRTDKATNTAPAAGRRPAGAPHTRRVMVVAGAVVVLGLGTYGWSLAAVANRHNQAETVAGLGEPSVVASSGKCVVSYAVWTDGNGKFTARVTVANRNDSPVNAWKLWFIMPGDQIVSGNGKVRLTQDANTVTLASAVALGPRKSVTLPISGRYQVSNAAPLAFTLNDNTCDTFVSSKPGEAPKQVQQLSNGKVQLVPTSGNPAPDISIDPGGVVHIKPTTPAPTTAPTPTGSTLLTLDPTTSPTATTKTTDPVAPKPPPGPSSTTTTTPTTAPTTTSPTPPTPTPSSPPIDCDEFDPTCNGST